MVIESGREVDWSKSIEYFKKYKDKKIDLTDSVSFSMMDRLKLDTAFTFDSDFKVRFKVAP